MNSLHFLTLTVCYLLSRVIFLKKYAYKKKIKNINTLHSYAILITKFLNKNLCQKCTEDKKKQCVFGKEWSKYLLSHS